MRHAHADRPALVEELPAHHTVLLIMVCRQPALLEGCQVLQTILLAAQTDACLKLKQMQGLSLQDIQPHAAPEACVCMACSHAASQPLCGSQMACCCIWSLTGAGAGNAAQQGRKPAFIVLRTQELPYCCWLHAKLCRCSNKWVTSKSSCCRCPSCFSAPCRATSLTATCRRHCRHLLLQACRHAPLPGAAHCESLLKRRACRLCSTPRPSLHAAQPPTCTKAKEHKTVWPPESLQCTCQFLVLP